MARSDSESTHNFAHGFLDSSVLFCVGAMALIGSFKAGVESDYSLLLTKSVLDGFVAIIFGGALGIGVAFWLAGLTAARYEPHRWATNQSVVSFKTISFSGSLKIS